MVEENFAQKEQLEKIYKKIKKIYGDIPPQMYFLGNIDVSYLEDFLTMVIRVLRHPTIEKDFFAFMRLHVAFKEDYRYCKQYNTQVLLASYPQKILDAVITSVDAMPLDTKHQALGKFALKSIYESRECTQADYDALYALGWNQKDVFDAIEHTATLFRNGRILAAYRTKD